jgi:hypothetical protein
MEEAVEKLKMGLEWLEKAGNDETLLGLSLISLHGSLEDALRQRLCEVLAYDCDRLRDTEKVKWKELLDLAEAHLGFTRSDIVLIAKMIRGRNVAAHGLVKYTGRRDDLDTYAQFIQDFVGLHISPISTTIYDPETPAYVSSPIPPRLGQPVSPPYTSLPHNLPVPGRSRSLWRAIGCYFIAVLLITCLSVLAFKYYSVWTQFDLFDDETGNSEEKSTLILDEDEKDNPVSATPDMTRNVPTEGDQDNTRTIESTPSAQDSTEEPDPAQAQPTTQIRVLSNSNVWESPDSEALIIGVAVGGDLYEVVEVNAEKTWYKIRLAIGQEGWIGSSRVEVVSP